MAETKLSEIMELKQKSLGELKTKYKELFGQEYLLLIRYSFGARLPIGYKSWNVVMSRRKLKAKSKS